MTVETRRTIFHGWLEQCQKNDTSIYELEARHDRQGRLLKLFKMITPVEPSKETGWNGCYDVMYCLWTGEERFECFSNMMAAYSTFERRRWEL